MSPAKPKGGEPNAVNQIDRATLAIRAARAENEKLQKQYPPGSPSWDQCGRVDDHLFDALSALGE